MYDIDLIRTIEGKTFALYQRKVILTEAQGIRWGTPADDTLTFAYLARYFTNCDKDAYVFMDRFAKEFTEHHPYLRNWSTSQSLDGKFFLTELLQDLRSQMTRCPKCHAPIEAWCQKHVVWFEHYFEDDKSITDLCEPKDELETNPTIYCSECYNNLNIILDDADLITATEYNRHLVMAFRSVWAHLGYIANDGYPSDETTIREAMKGG